MKNPAASSGVSSFREECDYMWGYIPHFVDVALINRPKAPPRKRAPGYVPHGRNQPTRTVLPDTGYRIPDTGYRIPDTAYRPPPFLLRAFTPQPGVPALPQTEPIYNRFALPHGGLRDNPRHHRPLRNPQSGLRLICVEFYASSDCPPFGE
jgi:hypothetical protein